MASAQVLPNPAAASSSARKQDLLEAGKRRLEEFRKRKKAEKEKKPVVADNNLTTSAPLVESSSPKAVISGPKFVGDSVDTLEPSKLTVGSRSTSTSSIQNADVGLPNGLHSVATSGDEHSDGQSQNGAVNRDFNPYRSSGLPRISNGYKDNRQDKISELEKVDANLLHKTVEQVMLNPEIMDDMKQDNVYPTAEIKLDNHDIPRSNAEQNVALRFRTSEENGNGIMNSNGMPPHHNDFGNKDHFGFKLKGRRISDSINRHLNIESTDLHTSDNLFNDYNSTSKDSFIAGFARSRPSFLDSINASRASTTSSLPSDELTKEDPSILDDVNSTNGDGNFVSSLPMALAKPNNQLSDIKHENVAEDKLQLSIIKDDNFASLEQHIEDLTQEKFSLQRTLDMSRSLSESLASENSSLTESFNQQGKVINQLKFDLDLLQAETKTQLLDFEKLKAEYANAQLECTAADERARILASEVIGLEEKALKLRSNELKLEKQLESSHAEITSFKRKFSSLEKEHRDFQSTIEALQEEKKLLQSQLLKASSHDIANDRNVMHVKVDASTSTMDLCTDKEVGLLETGSHLRSPSGELGPSSSAVFSEEVANLTFQHDSRVFYSDASGRIPDDHLKMIDNINALISELSLEKEELVQALAAESAMTSKLKDLNKEMSQKLEVQTQRLELLTAQQMANSIVQPRQVDTPNVHDTADYTDEGDEVVERVLGWIMKLFPGGPAKRRTSKLL